MVSKNFMVEPMTDSTTAAAAATVSPETATSSTESREPAAARPPSRRGGPATRPFQGPEGASPTDIAAARGHRRDLAAIVQEAIGAATAAGAGEGAGRPNPAGADAAEVDGGGREGAAGQEPSVADLNRILAALGARGAAAEGAGAAGTTAGEEAAPQEPTPDPIAQLDDLFQNLTPAGEEALRRRLGLPRWGGRRLVRQIVEQGRPAIQRILGEGDPDQARQSAADLLGRIARNEDTDADGDQQLRDLIRARITDKEGGSFTKEQQKIVAKALERREFWLKKLPLALLLIIIFFAPAVALLQAKMMGAAQKQQ